MKVEEIVLDKELYLFELDDVLFSRRDYLVQVYYLFSSFYEFSEGTIKANDLATFMTKILDLHGEEQVYLSTKLMFNIDDKYEDNFYRLMANAQIPIKLELFPQIQALLIKLSESNKQIAILTNGNPVEQLNKLRFVAWGTLEFLKDSLKVYFVDELKFSDLDPIDFIAEEYNLNPQHIVYID